MPKPTLSNEDAARLLFEEAHLIDTGQLEEWLALFTADGIYWLPIDEESDPTMEPSVLYDGPLLREQRVHQILHEPHYSQMPRSRTVHQVTNVVVLDDGEQGEAFVRCNLAVHELRTGDPLRTEVGQHRVLSGRCEYRLHFEGGWRIALKKVVLMNRDLPITNLPFIV